RQTPRGSWRRSKARAGALVAADATRVLRLDLREPRRGATSLRRPAREPGEEAMDEPDLVHEEQPESEDQETGGDPQAPVNAREPPGRIEHGRGDRDGDQHHPDDRPEPEQHKVRDGPSGSLDDR